MHPTITCGGCPAVWTATAACHCSGCHRTFANPSLFDDHRSAMGEHGSCRDPRSLRHAVTGAPLMFDRDGMWRGPEMTPAQLRLRFGTP